MIPARLHALFAVLVCGCGAPAAPAPAPLAPVSVAAPPPPALSVSIAKPSSPAPALLGAPVKERLELLFDGKSFQPTPKTARTLKSL
ncbi:MAG: hypothetical protein ACMG6S_10215 [Byssovorax sp.]